MAPESLIASDRKIDLIIDKTAIHLKKKSVKDQILFGFCFDFHLLESFPSSHSLRNLMNTEPLPFLSLDK